MPDAILPPPTREPFRINRPREDGKPIALLPTVQAPPFFSDAQFSISHVSEYNAAIHAAYIGFSKAESSLVEAAKALGASPPMAQAYARMQFMPDPSNAGLMQWPGMQPEALARIASDNLLPQMAIRSRVNDMRNYSCLSTEPWSPGWRVTLRESSETPSRQDRDDIRAAERFIWNCSRDSAYSDPVDRDAHRISQFEAWLAGGVADSLTFDGWSIWKDPDNVGRVRAFANLPAGMIRLALPGRGYRNDPRKFAALVNETNEVVCSFDREEMTWCVRNVRNDPNVCGYGWSESEMAIRVIQGFAGAIDLNVNSFDRNSIPNAMMLLKGDFWQEEQVDALQREWTNMKRGISKMWGMPVVAVPEDGDIELMNFMDMKGEELRYKDHINLMAGVYCIISQYPIRKFGMFASGNRRDNAPVQDESIETQGVDDPGLPAMLTFIEHRVNEYLLQPNWKRLRFKFEGKNPKEDARGYTERTKARTWSESRAQLDLPKLDTLVANPELKEFAEIMSLCPEDPAKVGAFQSMAVTMLEVMLGVDDSGDEVAEPGAPTHKPTDPASAQAHGHRQGVPRKAARVRAQAKQAEGATT
jgi:hypothetical protein